MTYDLFNTPIYAQHSHVHDRSGTMSHSEHERIGKAAMSLEARIKDFYKKHPNERFTAEDIERLVPSNCVLTSYRRSLTDLTKDGFLTHDTVNKKPGKYVMLTTYTYTV